MLTQSTVSVNNKWYFPRTIVFELKCWGRRNGMVQTVLTWTWQTTRLGKLQEHVYHSRNHDVDQKLKLLLIEEWEHFHQMFVDENDQAVAYTSSSLHSSTRRTFWTQILVVFLPLLVQTYTLTVICLSSCLQWTLLFWGDLTKSAIIIASVDRFYLNLVICLQLDIALSFQNSVKIWHFCHSYDNVYRGLHFFLETV